MTKRGGKLRLWRPLKTWHPHEWVPMKEAWQRVEAAVKSWSLTKRDLRLDLINRRLVAAVRRIAKDGTETRIILEPEYCQRLEFPYAWQQLGWEADAQEGEEWHFFVRRRELDERYPAADAMPSAAPTMTTQAREGQSKPGSADAWIDHVCPDGEWRLMTAKDIYKKIVPEAEKLEVKAPSYSAVAAALLKRST